MECIQLTQWIFSWILPNDLLNAFKERSYVLEHLNARIRRIRPSVGDY